MLQRSHRVYLLHQALLQLRVLDHLLLRQALYRVEARRRRRLRRLQHVPEPALPHLTHAVELVRVQDVPRLHLLVALQHYLF